MARLVHTADVHLHPDAPERRDALAAVLERAEELNADAVTIGGDLFENEVAAERLRPALRQLFADRPFPVVVIPGNHDRDAFEGDAFFGPAVRPSTAEPFEQLVLDGDGDRELAPDHSGDGIRLTCVPYTPTLTDDLLVALRDRDPFGGLDCLLVHCSLEAPGAAVTAGAGEEDAIRYAPVTRSELAALEFDVVLAGHYHGANRVALPNDGGPTGTTDASPTGTFLYPGTPASVTRAETGRRSLAVVADDATPRARLEPLESFHYDELSISVRPGEAEDALATIRAQVDTWTDRDVDARVHVEGFVDRDETAFAATVAEASGDVPHENEVRSATSLLEHPIYREFEAHLDAETAIDAAEDDEYDPERLCEDARQRVLAAMADLAAAGDLT